MADHGRKLGTAEKLDRDTGKASRRRRNGHRKVGFFFY